ncbi:MAG: sulfatase, partial [Bacteroidota bacterium]
NAFLGEFAIEGEREYIFAAADRFDQFYDHVRAARDKRYKYLRHPEPEMPYYLPIAYREQMGAMQELLRLRDAGKLTDVQAQWFRQQRPPEELFDTQSDPYELNNLANNPAYANKLAELRQACSDWLSATGDLGAIPEKDLITKMWGADWQQPQTNAPYAERDAEGRFLLQSSTPGATIGYRIMPQDSTITSWRVYTTPLERVDGDTIYAKADRIGYAVSELSIGF